IEKPGVERLEAIGDGQRRHEVAPDKTDQPLHLALVVALGRPAEAILEQIMEANLLARDVAIGLAKIRLGLPRTMAQRHKHLARSQCRLRNILAHYRIAAGEALFASQPLENPMRRMALLLVNAPVAFKHGVDPGHKRPEL